MMSGGGSLLPFLLRVFAPHLIPEAFSPYTFVSHPDFIRQSFFRTLKAKTCLVRTSITTIRPAIKARLKRSRPGKVRSPSSRRVIMRQTPTRHRHHQGKHLPLSNTLPASNLDILHKGHMVLSPNILASNITPNTNRIKPSIHRKLLRGSGLLNRPPLRLLQPPHLLKQPKILHGPVQGSSISNTSQLFIKLPLSSSNSTTPPGLRLRPSNPMHLLLHKLNPCNSLRHNPNSNIRIPR